MALSERFESAETALYSESVEILRFAFETEIYLDLVGAGGERSFVALTPKQAKRIAKKLRKAAGG